jgi:hypothetical protein
MENKTQKFDLEDRLVDFACMCLYGEAQAAESRADFLHQITCK